MTDEAGKPNDTVETAPQPVIEVVDTPVAAPEGQTQAQPAQAPLYFGKYRTLEDAEKAYSEAQRQMHEKAKEASIYRQMVEERQAAPTPAPAPAVDFGEKFREKLADDPWGTLTSMMEFQVNRRLEAERANQLAQLKKYQEFSSRPEYADIATDVASQLPFAQQPIDPIEGAFLKAKLAKLESQLAGGGMARPVTPPFVEPGNNASRGNNSSIRVELDSDAARFKADPNKMRDLARVIAKHKMAGGDMKAMSIDDWERANA